MNRMLLLLWLLVACEDVEPAFVEEAGDAGAQLDASGGRLAAPAIDSSTGAHRDAFAGEAGSQEVPAERPGGEEVTLAGGRALGLTQGNTRVFYGLPYGEAPVGALRFAPPQPVASWPGTFDATQPGPDCLQPRNRGALPGGDHAVSEDCLRLNVWAPRSGERLPVLVFVHGGKFEFGGGLDLDARLLSEATGAIVVGINFRLGALGHLVHPALDLPGAPSGNYELRDQQLALRWVRENIAAFGGDAHDVTLFGQSSGAQGICYHLFAHGSEGLFQRAILQSGACVDYPAVPLYRDRVARISQQLVDALCGTRDVATCLRELPGEQIESWKREGLIEAYGVDFLPQVDGVVLTEDPWASLARGAVQKVPLILGTQPNEWAIVQLYDGSEVPRPKSMLELSLVTYGLYPDDWLDVLAHYAPLGTPDDQANDALGRIVSDSWFHCPSRYLARGVEAHGASVYLYSFELAPAVHGQEADYVFGYPWISGQLVPPKFAEAAPLPLVSSLVDELQQRWGAFARSGEPNVDGMLSWPRHGEAATNMRFDREVSLASRSYEADCDLWDALHARRHARGVGP